MIIISINRSKYKEIISYNQWNSPVYTPNLDSEKILELFKELPPKVVKCFHLKGNIPEKKLSNAKATFIKNLDINEEILILFDATMFGSCKEGTAITNKKIYSSDNRPIRLDEIKDVLLLHINDAESRIGLVTDTDDHEYFLSATTERNVPLINFFVKILYFDNLFD